MGKPFLFGLSKLGNGEPRSAKEINREQDAPENDPDDGAADRRPLRRRRSSFR